MVMLRLGEAMASVPFEQVIDSSALSIEIEGPLASVRAIPDGQNTACALTWSRELCQKDN